MTATYVGSLTVGECIPVAVSARAKLDGAVALAGSLRAALDAALAIELPSLQARLEGLLALQASLNVTPPSLGASLEAAIKLVGALEASLELGLPGVDFQLAAVAALIAQLQVDLGSLQAHASLSAAAELEIEAFLDFSAQLLVQLGQPGVHLYTVTGDASDAGPDLAAVLGSGPPGTLPTDQVAGWLLIASDGGTIAVLEAVLGG